MSNQRKQIEQLEHEAEALRELLAEELSSAAPSDAAGDRVKMAVRHELNAQWMEQLPRPEPSAESVARTRQAVHELLTEHGPSGPAGRWWMKRWAWGAVAAAAAVALAVGIFSSRDAGSPSPDRSTFATNGEDLAADVEQYVMLMENLADEPNLADGAAGAESLDDRMATVQTQLASLSEELSQDTEMVQTLNEIMSDIDELLEEGAGTRQQGLNDVAREALG